MTRVLQIVSAKVLRSGSHSGRKKPTRLTRSIEVAEQSAQAGGLGRRKPVGVVDQRDPGARLADGLADRGLAHHRLPGVEQRRDAPAARSSGSAPPMPCRPATAISPIAIPSPTASSPRSISWAYARWPQLAATSVASVRTSPSSRPRTCRGRPAWQAPASAMSAGRSIDLRVGDRAAVDAPLLQDRGVRAVSHQLLDRGQHRRGHARWSWAPRCRRERWRSCCR